MIWRYTCPEGHVDVHRRARKGGYYCGTCLQYYDSDPVDQKQGGASA